MSRLPVVGGRCRLLLLAFNFLAISLVLPTVAVVLDWQNPASNGVDPMVYPILVPFTAAIIIGGFLLLVATKQVLGPYDVLATKLILVFQLLIILQAVQSALVMFMYHMADMRNG